MARLEIDDRAFSDPRLKKLARMKGMTRFKALGILNILWHDSQEQGRAEATAEEIDGWLEVAPAEGGRIRSALVSAGYLGVSESNIYQIRGNSRRILIVNQKRLRARSCAIARWSKPANKEAKQEITDASRNAHACRLRNAEKREERGESREERGEREEALAESCSDSRAVENLGMPLELAFSACEASQDDSWARPEKSVASAAPRGRKVKTSAEKTAKAETGAGQVMAAYCRSYKARYDKNPEIMGPCKGAARRLAIDLGVDRACALVEAYLSMNDAQFLNESHRLSILQMKVNKVALFLDKGIAVTQKMANSLETHANNNAVASRVLDRLSRAEGVASGDW